MQLRQALVASVRSNCSADLQLKVREFFKPPLLEAKVSPFTVAVLENDAIGLSYNLFHGDETAMARYREWPLQELAGKRAGELVEWVLDDDLLRRTAGLAVLNALSQRFMNDHPECYPIDADSDLFGLMGVDRTSRVGLVGYFRPLMERLLAKAGEVVVLEKSPELLLGCYPFTMTDDPKALRRCNRVLLTATTVLNDSLPDLIPHCAGAEFVAVMGPTAGFLPDALFALGVQAVGYSRVEDPARFLQRFTDGVKWGDATRKVWVLASSPRPEVSAPPTPGRRSGTRIHPARSRSSLKP